MTEPATCELVVNVRVEDPTVAVIVTDVALVACQFRVTLCPELMEFAFAEKIRVGGLEPLLVLAVLPPEQEHKHNIPINPRAIPGTKSFVISSYAH